MANVISSNGELFEETAEVIFDIISESSRPLKAELLGKLSIVCIPMKLDNQAPGGSNYFNTRF